jgi:autotransporter passenger strand-loop-strand repeat protein
LNSALEDPATPNKLYLDQIAAVLASNPIELFTTSGSITAGFNADIEADLGFLGSYTLFSYDSPRFTLVDFSTAATGGSDPNTVYAGQTPSGVVVSGGIFEVVQSGGIAIAFTILGGGGETVESGGQATRGSVASGAYEHVVFGGFDTSATLSGGEMDLYGSASGVTVLAGGAEFVLRSRFGRRPNPPRTARRRGTSACSGCRRFRDRRCRRWRRQCPPRCRKQTGRRRCRPRSRSPCHKPTGRCGRRSASRHRHRRRRPAAR